MEGERIEIEDVQSGERIRVSSVARAVSWMRRRMGEPADDAGDAGPDAAGD